MDGLESYGAKEDTLVILGGIIPEDDRPALLDHGVAAVFGPGTPMAETVEFVRENAPERR
jgi:methylmalonyl-CoA mutase C-terminal domain/subunit